ncbi:hypothetical protein [Erythrobacter aureus]|uniref:Uncharacterized protein n=1 Tax=Erythrobacter aureus TaxID=2182384 RepID=A0A345YIR5_9SPHN|nr:hypothetical protein [Erythrobacter aureus]AXK43817.1 hypothetical protein DVR09_15285 [Erythrobacter aureus]
MSDPTTLLAVPPEEHEDLEEALEAAKNAVKMVSSEFARLRSEGEEQPAEEEGQILCITDGDVILDVFHVPLEWYEFRLDAEDDTFTLIIPYYYVLAPHLIPHDALGEMLSYILSKFQALLADATPFFWQDEECLDENKYILSVDMPLTDNLHQTLNTAFNRCLAVARRELPWTYANITQPARPLDPFPGFALATSPSGATSLLTDFEGSERLFADITIDQDLRFPTMICLEQCEDYFVQFSELSRVVIFRDRDEQPIPPASELEELYESLRPANSHSPCASLQARDLDITLQRDEIREAELNELADRLEEQNMAFLKDYEKTIQESTTAEKLPSTLLALAESMAPMHQMQGEGRSLPDIIADDDLDEYISMHIGMTMAANLYRRVSKGENLVDIQVPSLFSEELLKYVLINTSPVPNGGTETILQVLEDSTRGYQLILEQLGGEALKGMTPGPKS